MNATPGTALITGASAGLGVEFARQLHARGYSVVLVARRAEVLKHLADEFNTLKPSSAQVIVADLAGDIRPVVEYIQHNRIDLLVNNAGFGSFGYFDELNLEHELNMVALNVVATLRLAHAVIPQMKARRRGVIIALSSIVGFQPLPFMATYSATKAFNYTHSLALRHELKSFGIKVLTVCPGPTDTEFGGVARMPGTVAGVGRDSAEEVVSEALTALDRDRAWVVPCLRSKVLSLPSRVLPKNLCTWIAGKMLNDVLIQTERKL